MPRAFLVLNAGSSSIKFTVFREGEGDLVPDLRGLFERLEGEGDAAPHLVARRGDEHIPWRRKVEFSVGFGDRAGRAILTRRPRTPRRSSNSDP